MSTRFSVSSLVFMKEQMAKSFHIDWKTARIPRGRARTSLLDLPNELLLQILLDGSLSEGDLFAMGLVCRHFNLIALPIFLQAYGIEDPSDTISVSVPVWDLAHRKSPDALAGLCATAHGITSVRLLRCFFQEALPQPSQQPEVELRATHLPHAVRRLTRFVHRLSHIEDAQIYLVRHADDTVQTRKPSDGSRLRGAPMDEICDWADALGGLLNAIVERGCTRLTKAQNNPTIQYFFLHSPTLLLPPFTNWTLSLLHTQTSLTHLSMGDIALAKEHWTFILPMIPDSVCQRLIAFTVESQCTSLGATDLLQFLTRLSRLERLKIDNIFGWEIWAKCPMRSPFHSSATRPPFRDDIPLPRFPHLRFLEAPVEVAWFLVEAGASGGRSTDKHQGKEHVAFPCLEVLIMHSETLSTDYPACYVEAALMVNILLRRFIDNRNAAEEDHPKLEFVLSAEAADVRNLEPVADFITTVTTKEVLHHNSTAYRDISLTEAEIEALARGDAFPRPANAEHLPNSPMHHRPAIAFPHVTGLLLHTLDPADGNLQRTIHSLCRYLNLLFPHVARVEFTAGLPDKKTTDRGEEEERSVLQQVADTLKQTCPQVKQLGVGGEIWNIFDSDDGVKKKKGKEWTRKVEVKEKVGEEVERLTKKLHGLKVGDINYAATYIELVRLAPITASVIPKPTSSIWGQTENQTSTSGVNTVQAPLAPPRRKPCYFCNNYGHVLRACRWVEDYVAAKRVVWKDNLLYFPDERGGQAVEFNQQGLKVVVDKAFGGQLERAGDRPPHMATTSFVVVTPVSATFATMEEVYDSECKGEEEDEIALMEVFEELREAEAFAMTRGKAKELEKQKADEEKGTTGRKEKSAKVSSMTLEKAFTYESAAADPDAASKMYDRIMKTPIHDMTVGDLVSLSGDLRKRIVEQCRTTKTPVTVNATAATMSVQSIPLEYCTPLREVAVRVAAKVDERALLDDGLEIVVMRRDLWEETRHKVNMRRNMMMETVNGDLEKMEGCAEFIEVEVNGLKTWAHTFVVPQAPFRLLLGRPWQKSVLLQKAEFEDGRLHVTIHSPLDRSKKCVVEMKERESSGGKGQTLMFRSREDVLEAWRRWREGGCGNGLEEEPEGGEEPPFPTSYANFILGTTFEQGPTAQTLAYKKVARRIKPVSTTMPERAKVKCHFPEDPLATLPAVPVVPPDFKPGIRLTEERLANLGIMENVFLWPEERKLAAAVLLVNETALAWSEEEKGRFREDYIEPVVIPVIEHIPWFKKSPPFPPAVREKIKKVVEKKSPPEFTKNLPALNKKNGDIRIVHNLAPLNEVTIKDGSQLPIIDQYAELCSGRGVYSTLDIFVGFDHSSLAEESRDLTTFDTPLGTHRLTVLPQGWTGSPGIFHRQVAFLLQHETEIAPNFVDDVMVLGP
ncbi:unnamed protein product [Cyclocybe aegerita]|uniref:F-box domain-containing protein n=1 Tax=Cyclocybe aegerita TaxID=1973307 RepID=A0A8S0VVX5_CYCAE|nr:unnamed protein product [Cyclocybe aegerita]